MHARLRETFDVSRRSVGARAPARYAAGTQRAHSQAPGVNEAPDGTGPAALNKQTSRKPDSQTPCDPRWWRRQRCSSEHSRARAPTTKNGRTK